MIGAKLLEKILGIKNEDFNAVIEGTYHDDWCNSTFKIASLKVPENASSLNDGTYKYSFYGRTEDFKKVQEASCLQGIETRIDFLGFCKGVVLPYQGGIPNILERPRAVILKDGRVFLDKDFHLGGYMEALREGSIISTAGEIFNDQRVSRLYHKVAQ